ncbi:mRNA splicing factor [Ochromonadaceae sp. CCMP2298]|nr:mRNA splicing factor [Ochromonadaceae sp. CCMP2298]|mmetsp:Transcript_28024/g.62062  ORF Transcript_28024/g.62062 Transcript_28024/m.62062 type:complete len:145 (-) Transcript_28024:144-578(-)
MADADRKRKLQEIRAAKAKKDATVEPAAPVESEAVVEGEEQVSGKKIKFRNYQPYDGSLKKKAAAVAEKTNDSTVSELVVPVSVETDVIKLELQKYTEAELNIMPKKPNWDLKSQVEGKLLKLKKRTQKAIVEILREKLAADVE